MFNLGFSEMIILGVIILVFVGPNELPELARMVGRFLNEFRRSTDALKDEWQRSANDLNPKKQFEDVKNQVQNSIAPADESQPKTEEAAPSYPPDNKYER